METETIKINCPHCGHSLEYWTIETYIICPKCNGNIDVKPCGEKKEEETEEGVEIVTVGKPSE